MYDRIAVGYDLAERLYGWWKRVQLPEMRRQLLKDVIIRPNFKVLEVSVGTGANVWLLPGEAHYFGLDISWKMLERCRRNGKKHNRSIELVFGSAEHLPFRDERFDCVYHVGGINFFNDSLQAVREMIRVARPGTRIVISDEVEEVVKSSYERNPLIRRFFRGRKKPVVSPLDHVPAGMRDLKIEQALAGKAYVLSFTRA
jgi:ubiquinone/menaquinone biosynthesis C-methylase UbiE